MYLKTTLAVVGLAATGWFSGSAQGAEMTNEQLRAEMEAVKAEIAQLRAEKDESWMNERRAEEIKTLVRDVLADADTRASLLDNQVTAGWNGKNFFLSSDDGGFYFQPQFQAQFRYILNDSEADDDPLDESDDFESGFQVRRFKFGAKGHVWNPRFKYNFKWGVGRGDGDIELDAGHVMYEFDNGFWVDMQILGKGAFLREERVSSSRQLAVERSVVNEQFGTDKVQGVLVGWKNDMLSAEVMVNDGYQSGVDDFSGDFVDLGISARVEWVAAGSRSQFKDYSSWAEDELGILVGAALHYDLFKEAQEEADAVAMGIGDTDSEVFLWTIDAAAEYQGANAAISFTGMHPEIDSDTSSIDFDPVFGLVLQGGYNINDTIEPFIRWEHIFRDEGDDLPAAAGAASFGNYGGNFANLYGYEDDLDIVTFGVNYYLTKHKSKFTFDVVYVLDDMGRGESGLGLVETSDDDEQIAVRAQYQLLF